MAVRIPQVPGLGHTPLRNPHVSASAAAAPARALGSLASSIASVSKPFEEVAACIQGATNARQISETRNALDENRAQFLLEIEKEPDPQKRLAAVPDFF